MYDSFIEEFHAQLQAARTALVEALHSQNPCLIEAARARVNELGDVARRHHGLVRQLARPEVEEVALTA